MPKKSSIDEKLYCMKNSCMAMLTLPAHYEVFRKWDTMMVYDTTGWYVSPSWEDNAWDGMIFCPDHEADGEDFYASISEDNSGR